MFKASETAAMNNTKAGWKASRFTKNCGCNPACECGKILFAAVSGIKGLGLRIAFLKKR
jgi:hypothetical protein